MPKIPLVSAVIVTWNGRDLLSDCLIGLSKVDYERLEIIIVDNGSNDGTQELIKKYPKIKLFENEKNLGFAKANNIGFENSKGEAILFLNNDTLVNRGFLKTLVETLYSDPKIGMVQPKILVSSEGEAIDSVGSFLTNSGLLLHYGYYKNRKAEIFNKRMPIYTAKGACMLARREVLEKTGVFDEDYFAYFEETDLCNRIWLAGYKIIYEPNATILHRGGRTSNRFPSSFVQYHSFKNRIATYIKDLGYEELTKILPLHILLCEAASIFYLINRRWRLFYAVQKALFWNMFHLMGTLKKREEIQGKIRRVEDSEFIGLIKRKIGLKYLYYLFTGLEKMPVKEYEKI